MSGHEDILKDSRSEKITSLGFLCYNLYVDGVMSFPEMNAVVSDIKKAGDAMASIEKYGDNTHWLDSLKSDMNKKLTELGCICYNLYVDKKLINSQVLALCDTISSINSEIVSGQSSGMHTPEFQSPAPQSRASAHAYPLSEEEAPSPAFRQKNVTQSELKVTCPYGMEPIPPDYKKCECGYRNKHVARFCGRCGAKLP